MSDSRVSIRRIVGRWPWHRRVYFHVLSAWYGLLDWLVDQILGIPR